MPATLTQEFELPDTFDGWVESPYGPVYIVISHCEGKFQPVLMINERWVHNPNMCREDIWDLQDVYNKRHVVIASGAVDTYHEAKQLCYKWVSELSDLEKHAMSLNYRQ